MKGSRVRLGSISALVVAACGGFATPASATEFQYTGGQQEYQVPAGGVTAVHVEAVGGNGAGAGGTGAWVSADLSVESGEILYIEVGNNGSGRTAGWNGGGGGGIAESAANDGFGGGGASDVRLVSGPCCIGGASPRSRQIVAGGGGGGGGGSAGSAGGSAGNAGASRFASGGGGPGGTSSGGQGGENCDGAIGEEGEYGVEWGGGNGESSPGAGGGGSGGGYYGGGGGGGYQGTIYGCPSEAGAAGGGGGSSYLGPQTSNGIVSPLGGDGHPRVVITVQQPPTCPASVAAATPAGGGPAQVSLTCTGSPSGYTIVSSPEHGSLGAIDQATAQVTYTPTAGFTGQDKFTYLATNSGGRSNTTTVTITVPAAAPTCPASVPETTPAGGGSIQVSLACTGNPSGYTIVSSPEHGSLGAIDQATAQVTYTPTAGFTGQDKFTYQATNSGGTSQTTTVSITVPPAASTATTVRSVSVRTAQAPRVEVSLTWRFGWTKRFTVVESLVVHSVPPGGHVEVTCRGAGCPFKLDRSATVASTKHCHTRCPRHKPPQGPAVSLAGLFNGRHLGVGTRIVVNVLKAGWTSKSFTFTVRSGRSPSVSIA
jgi:hypothetical protein